jgi:hypothetical protein
MRIQLTVSAEEALAIGTDLAYIKAEKDRKIIQPHTYRFLVKVFREAKATSLNAYLQGSICSIPCVNHGLNRKEKNDE